MSIFDGDDNKNPDNQPGDDGKQDQGNENQKSFLEQLIEARGESWKDPETIAKGKIEADNHIKELERQIEEMRTDLGKQEYSKELLEALKANKGPDSSGEKPEGKSNKENTGDANRTDTTSKSEDELKDLVEKTLSEREQQAKRETNIKTVDEGMQEKFGTEAGAVLTEKAKTLGMTKERLREIAEESPQAFFTLIGEPEAIKQPPVGRASVRTDGGNFDGSTKRDWQYYQEIRRKDRRRYYSKEVQRQLIEDKKRLGDAFGMP